MKDKLTKLLRAGFAGIAIPSHEPQRVEADVAAAAKSAGFTFYVWSCTKGMYKIKPARGQTPAQPEHIAQLEEDEMVPPHFVCLSQFDRIPREEKAVVLLHGYNMFMSNPDPMLYQRIKDALLRGKMCNHTLIIGGGNITLPAELEKDITVVDFKLPDREQITEVVQRVCKSANIELNGSTEHVVDACSGGTTTEIENWLALSVVESDGKDIDPAVVAMSKANAIKKGGLIEVIDVDVGIEDIGGLDVLKNWLLKRSRAFTKEARDYGLPMPRGYLMVGIPGCSKTLAAKATAKILGVPLLKLDAGRLFGSLVGQSESNIRSVIETCEAIAPCVVLCDEIEKGFSGSKSSGVTDSGVSARVLGTFLQWMNDKTAPVFVAATANSISALPPEFLRKGRFDQLFFNDLPTVTEREEIWKIQIKKYGRKPKGFDTGMLALATPDWTGAEIEALIRESLFSAFGDGEPTTKLLLELAKEQIPLSTTMAEDVQRLRDWADGRAVRSSKREEAA